MVHPGSPNTTPLDNAVFLSTLKQQLNNTVAAIRDFAMGNTLQQKVLSLIQNGEALTHDAIPNDPKKEKSRVMKRNKETMSAPSTPEKKTSQIKRRRLQGLTHR